MLLTQQILTDKIEIMFFVILTFIFSNVKSHFTNDINMKPLVKVLIGCFSILLEFAGNLQEISI